MKAIKQLREMTAFIVHVAMSVQDISDQRLAETASSLSNHLNKCEQRAIKWVSSMKVWRKHAVIDSAASESWAGFWKLVCGFV